MAEEHGHQETIRKRKQLKSQHLFQGHVPNDLRPSTRPHIVKFPPPPNNIELGTKPFTHGSLGSFQTELVTELLLENGIRPFYKTHEFKP
jgi:hypothetical protein